MPFVVVRPNRGLRRFSWKQRIQCQLPIVVIFILTIGCGYTIFILTKKLIQGSKNFFKKLKNFKFKQDSILYVELIKMQPMLMKKFLRIF